MELGDISLRVHPEIQIGSRGVPRPADEVDRQPVGVVFHGDDGTITRDTHSMVRAVADLLHGSFDRRHFDASLYYVYLR